MKAGRKVTSIVSWLATSWFFTQEEISSPMPSATSTYSIEAPNSTPERAAQRHVEQELGGQHAQREADQRRAAKYGIVLPSRISSLRTGVTSSASSVPRSHSRAITIAVSSPPISVMTSTTRPGTRK